MSLEEVCFDLNTHKVHNTWDTAKALRELIANACDEQMLSGTRPITLGYQDQTVTIRDYGRGLKLEHLLQDQSYEKNNSSSNTMGKFGYGLKDAIAYLFNSQRYITIASVHLALVPQLLCKVGTTIPSIHMKGYLGNYLLEGTEIKVYPVSQDDFQAARGYFVSFAGYRLICKTRFGSIYEKAATEKAKIFISGQLVSHEDSYHYHYDIIPTKKIRDSQNRERVSLNRSVYSSRVSDIIRAAVSENEEIRTWLAGYRGSDGELSRSELRALARSLRDPEDDDAVIVTPVVIEPNERSVFSRAQNLQGILPDLPEIQIGCLISKEGITVNSTIQGGKIIIDRSCLETPQQFFQVLIKAIAEHNGTSPEAVGALLALRL